MTLSNLYNKVKRKTNPRINANKLEDREKAGAEISKTENKDMIEMIGRIKYILST
jgi:hypothetical protein